MSKCIYCDAPFVTLAKRKGIPSFKLSRQAHYTFAAKALDSKRNRGQRDANLEAHVRRLMGF